CLVCQEEKVKLSDTRKHVGEHILQASRSSLNTQDDDGTHELQGGETLGLDPCGFCGRDSNVAGCLKQLQKGKKGGMTVVSTCPYRHETLKYKAA
ncbi:hypothetical protein BKA70DRAFT_1050271, partial [Coprinopsis sp. MPI-PUGE-AT-0042]